MVSRCFLLLLLGILPAAALPDVDEARRILGSPDFALREALTLELWESGSDGLPILRALARDSHPEVAIRAAFVLKRMSMGLGPKAPDDLLALTERADQAVPKNRSARLGDLLGHEAGHPVALFFLNQWLSDPQTPTEDRMSLIETCLETLLEDRRRWGELLTYAFAVEARAILIGTLCHQEILQKERMIAILANDDLRAIHRLLRREFESLPAETHRTLARLAVLRGDLDLALETLSRLLAQSDTPESARAIAFLEHLADLPPRPVDGPWENALNLFRARTRLDDHAILRLAESDGISPVLAYESRLLADQVSLPEGLPDADSPLLPALHLAFGDPPGEPDPEALTSSVLADWPALARTLTALAHPVEAAERLASEGHPDSAINLLWRTGHRQEALTLSEGVLADLDPEQHSAVRLTLTAQYLQEGENGQALATFRPLLGSGISSATQRAQAIRMMRKMLPLSEIISLEPHLTSARPFQRDRAVAPFLDHPPLVAAFWYDYFRAQAPATSPTELIDRTRAFLAHDLTEARRLLVSQIAEVPDKLLLPSDPLYQNALYLRTPGALDMVLTAAWHELSTRDLVTLIRSETWSLAQRRQALAAALVLDPVDPVLRWFDLQLNQRGDPETILRATLGDPGLALQIGQLTGKRESLATAVRLASLNNPAALRCLTILGRSHLQNGNPQRAARFLRAGLLGGIAMGTRPAPTISELLENLESLYQARHLTAPTETTRQLWAERLAGIGTQPLSTQ